MSFSIKYELLYTLLTKLSPTESSTLVRDLSETMLQSSSQRNFSPMHAVVKGLYLEMLQHLLYPLVIF